MSCLSTQPGRTMLKWREFTLPRAARYCAGIGLARFPACQVVAATLRRTDWRAHSPAAEGAAS